MAKPRIVILAGPNGAGKTTLSKYLLPAGSGVDEFVNADRIALGLSAFAPEKVAFEAGRIMLNRLDSLMKEKASFAFETTLASKSFAKLAGKAQKVGYVVELIYVALPSYMYAQRRVSARVRAGGHSIPPDVIKRRFFRSLWNLQNVYIPIVDRWWVYDNSSAGTPKLVARGSGKIINVSQEQSWQSLIKHAQKKL
jgi:predicted ABC-type ATPase